jgi:medium-chain acyl-[acyl-carrier-protein] hydrolase
MMSASSNNARWFLCATPRSEASVRLFCFPFAGAGASIYRAWGAALPSSIEVRGVQLPGRESRMQEPRELRAEVMATRIAAALEEYLDRPIALFGYSMGALLAFEVARELRRRGRRAPLCLLVAAMRAPHVPPIVPPLGRLPNAELVAAVDRHYRPADPGWQIRELRDALLPVLRDDMCIADDYRCAEEPPLACPIHAFSGIEDASVPHAAIERWRDQTSADFSLNLFPGGHFFLGPERQALLVELWKRVTRSLAKHARARGGE